MVPNSSLAFVVGGLNACDSMDVVASPVSMTAPEIKAISDSAETQKRKVGLRPSLSDGASVEDGHEQVFELTKTPLLKPVYDSGIDGVKDGLH